MKKALLFVAVVLIAGAFSSCKKDYTCECVFTNGMDNISVPFQDAKKADAKDACTTTETTYKVADPGVVCTLK